MNFDLSKGRSRVPCNEEKRLTAIQLATVLRAFHFFRMEDKALKDHLQSCVSPKIWAAAQKEAKNLEAPVNFWKSAKRDLSEGSLRWTAYKLWILSALSPEADQRRASAFIDKVREIWELPWLEALSVTQAMLNSDSVKHLEDSLLRESDRQTVLALISLLIHADGVMHVSEVSIFKRSIELLELNPGKLDFLHHFSDRRGVDLAAELGPLRFGAALPHLLRTILADGVPRPNEREVLRGLIEASKVPNPTVTAACNFVALERGLHLDID